MAGSTTNLAIGLHNWKDAYEKAGELENMYNSIKWPLDYFLKCWNANKKIYYAQVNFLHYQALFNGILSLILFRFCEDVKLVERNDASPNTD
jgi:hypothetical protein